MKEINPGDICEHCQQHKATTIWIGEGGSLAATRDYMQAKWCTCCVLQAQIKHAETVAKQLPKLRKELKTACASI